MSGPIVRTGTTPAFWKNWDQAFGGKPAGKKNASGGETKSINAFAAKKAAKKVAKKAAKKAAAKKKK
jgi:hypothetical protein